MADDEGFKIGSAYVEVGLKDNTGTDEEKVRRRIEDEPPVEIPTKAADPITAAWRAKLDADLKSLASSSLKIPTSPDAEQFRMDLAGQLAQIKATVHGDIPIEPAGLAEFRAKVDADVKAASEGISARIPVEPTVDEAKTKAAAIQAGGMTVNWMALAIAAGAPQIGGALLAGVSLGVVGLAVLAQRNSVQVHQAFTGMANSVMDETKQASASTTGFLVTAAQEIQAEYARLGPELSDAFSYAGPDIAILTNGLDNFAQGVMPGVVASVRDGQPIVRGFSDLLGSLGATGGQTLTTLSQHSDAFGRDFQTLGPIVSSVAGLATNLIVDLGTMWAQHGGQIETVFSQIDTIGTRLAGGALPLLSGEFGVVLNVANELLGVLSPIAPELGMIAGAVGPAYLGFKNFSTIQDGMTSFSSKLTSFATTATAAASSGEGLAGKFPKLAAGTATAATGLSKVGSILSNGGVLGIAIAGAGLLLDMLGQKQQEAAQKASDHASAENSLANALRASGGAIDANVRASEAKSLQDDKNVKAIFDNGTSLSELTDDVLTNNSAIGLNIQTLQIQSDALGQQRDDLVANAGRTDDMTGSTQKQIDALTSQKDSVDAQLGSWQYLNGQYADSVKKQQDLALAATGSGRSMLAAASNSSQLVGAITTVGDLSKTATDRLNALQLELKIMSEGGMEKANDEVSKFYAGLDGLGQKLASDTGKILDSAGALNEQSQKGRDAQSAIESARDSMAGYAEAAANAGVPSDQINSHLVDMANNLEHSLLPAFGGNKKALDALLTSMGLVPSQIATEVTTPGAVLAFQDVTSLRSIIGQLPPNTPVTVTGITAAAEAKLAAVGYQVTHLPNGNVTVTAEADTSPAERAINSFVARMNAAGPGITIRASGPVGGLGYALGGLVQRNATGNLDGLTPMPSSLATMVPPNTWRVVGDNLTAPEAFIPLNGSQRSRQLTAEVAARQGMALSGGSAGKQITVNNYISQQPQEDGSVMAARVSAETSWALMTSVGG